MKIEWTEQGTTECDDVQAFRDMHPSADIDAIDGKECIGQCEGCDSPIVQGDKYQPWSDGEITCKECSECHAEQLLTA